MASFTWKGPASGQWGEDSLWAGNVVPNDAQADVSLPAGSYTVTVAAGTAFVARSVAAGAGAALGLAGGLTLGANSTLGTVVVQPGGRLSSASGVKIDTLDNAGTVSATVPGSFMQLTGGTVTNTGTFAATASGTYLFVNGATLTNLQSGVLSGGTYSATGALVGGSVATIDIARAGVSTEIATLAATVELRFVNSALQGRSAGGALRTLESTLATIAPGGVLRVLDGRGYSTAQALSVAGRLELGGGKLTASGGLSVTSGGTIAGFGTIGTALSLAGELTVTAGTLALTGGLSGSGTATIDAGATLQLAASSPGVSIGGAGVLRVASGTLSLGQPLGGAPVVVVAAGATLDLVGAGASTLALSASTARVALNAAGFTGRIAGLQTGNVLTLKDIAATGVGVAATGGAFGGDSELTLATAGGSVVLKLVGDYSGKSFALAPSAGGGTEVRVQGVSFAPGVALWDRPTVTWSFAQANYPLALASFSSFVDPVAQAELAALWRAAFARWSQVTGLALVEVADTPGATGQADIRVGWDNFGNPPSGQIGNAQSSFSAAARTFFPGTLVRLQDPSVTPLVAGSGGALVYQGTVSSAYQVMLHEIGHALGLDHSSAAVDPASLMTTVATAANRDLNLSDIAGIRALYAGLPTAPPATIGIAPLLASRAEGQAGATDFTFTVTRTGDTAAAASADYTVAGSGPTPASAADFTGNALPTGSVSFAPGEATRTVTISIAGDTTIEPNEAFTITLANPTGATLGNAAAAGTIVNDDAALAIAAAAATRPEGVAGASTAYTFTVTRTGDTTVAHSAKFTATGSGANPADAADFAGNAFPTGEVAFAPGAASQTITVTVLGDSTVEPDEGFAVTLSSPSTGATIAGATATGTILADEAGAPDVDIRVSTKADETFFLGAGTDTVVFSAARDTYRIGITGEWTVVSGPDGTDTLKDVELLQFGASAPITAESLRGQAGTHELMSFITGGQLIFALPLDYSGPLDLTYVYPGTDNDDVVAGTKSNDFMNLAGGNDAAQMGAGDDIVDGGGGNNFLTGGPGRDTFFIDGRDLVPVWSCITDWEEGEALTLWGWTAGVSKAAWSESDGLPGYLGATMFADIDGNGLVETAITWTGKSRAELPVGQELTVSGIGVLYFA